jgi:hypothetical protein
VVETTQETPVAPRVRERPDFTPTFLEYVSYQKSAAIQAGLLANPRKGKEVAALLLLLSLSSDHGFRLSIHSCHSAPLPQRDQRSYREVDARASALADRLGLTGVQGEAGIDRLSGTDDTTALYEAIGRLMDDELDQLVMLIPILCLGQQDAGRLDAGESLINRIAADLGLGMRAWWTPDVAFLSALRRDQIIPIAIESGAAERLHGLHDRSKKDLVEALAEYFRTKTGADTSDEHDRRAEEWLPGAMRFPAISSPHERT